jgi:hypothetical protein
MPPKPEEEKVPKPEEEEPKKEEVNGQDDNGSRLLQTGN